MIGEGYRVERGVILCRQLFRFHVNPHYHIAVTLVENQARWLRRVSLEQGFEAAHEIWRPNYVDLIMEYSQGRRSIMLDPDTH